MTKKIVGSLPADVVAALQSEEQKNGNGEPLFNVCLKHWTPVSMAIWTSSPGNGAPILGFVPVTDDGNRTIINTFMGTYWDAEGHRQKHQFFTLNELLQIKFSCTSFSLAAAIEIADPGRAAQARAQVQLIKSLMRA